MDFSDYDSVREASWASAGEGKPPTPEAETSDAASNSAPPWALVVISSFLGAAIALTGVAIFGGFSEDVAEPAVAASPAVVVAPQSTTEVGPNAVEIPMVTSPADVDAAAVGRAVIPSIVSVEVGRDTVDGFLPEATGSGVIIDCTGYVVTNDHVVENGEQFQVVLSDSRIFEAELVGTDPVTDLAVLLVDAPGLEPLEFGTSDSLDVGAPAVAVGSPLGLDGGPSLTVGVLSATGRQVRTTPESTLYGMLQTDAPITQGSSGGALVDSSGRLIGITTAVGVSEIGVEGIGFASPVELVERVVAEIIGTGAVEHAFIGITGSTAYEEISDNGAFPSGVLVNTVEPDTGAEAGGLRIDDVITAVDAQEITTMEELIALMRRKAVGESATLDIMRGDADLALTIVFGVRPPG
jgi:S1-C subfamily serine protease